MLKRPKLTESGKQKRIEVATENILFNVDLWKKCVFIDEKIFETGPKGDIRIRRLPNTRYDDENVMKIQNSSWQSHVPCGQVMCHMFFLYGCRSYC